MDKHCCTIVHGRVLPTRSGVPGGKPLLRHLIVIATLATNMPPSSSPYLPSRRLPVNGKRCKMSTFGRLDSSRLCRSWPVEEIQLVGLGTAWRSYAGHLLADRVDGGLGVHEQSDNETVQTCEPGQYRVKQKWTEAPSTYRGLRRK